jgi:hypothetical protein
MKKIILLVALLTSFVISNAQSNPCPDIQSYGLAPISFSGSNCTSKIFVYATGDISSAKNLQITVYSGAIAPGNIISQSCNVVPKNSPSTLYETAPFTVNCTTSLTYVIRRGTSSNGLCGGGECGLTINVEGGPLPVKISTFNAQRKSNTVLLSWKTAAEINSKDFVIQRGINNDFKDIATIASNNLAIGSSYNYTDVSPLSGLSSYRLKMVDLDGTVAYSEIRLVKETVFSSSDFTVYPNPNRGNARITVFETSASTDVQLIDQSGRMIQVVNLQNRNTVDFTSIKTGMYIVRVVNKVTGETSLQKLNVVN